MSIVRLRHWLRIPLLLLLGLLATTIPRAQEAQSQSGQIANRTYGLEQVMRVQAALNASNGAPNQHSSVVVNQGYVVEVYSTEGNNPQAGINSPQFGQVNSAAEDQRQMQFGLTLRF